MDTKIVITLGCAILLEAAGIIWWAGVLQSEVRHNDFKIQIISKDVEKNSEFVELWPAGKWGSGSLPDDVKQNLKIERLEIQVLKITDKLYNGIH